MPLTKAEIKRQDKLAKRAQQGAIENHVRTDCDEALPAETARAAETSIRALSVSDRIETLGEARAILGRCLGALDARFEQLSQQRIANLRAVYYNPTKNEQLRRDEDSVLAEIHVVKDAMTGITQMVDQLETKQRHGDECSKVFRDTIDKKQSDLTTRESESIKACQALDLYRETNEK